MPNLEWSVSSKGGSRNGHVAPNKVQFVRDYIEEMQHGESTTAAKIFALYRQAGGGQAPYIQSLSSLLIGLSGRKSCVLLMGAL